MKTIALLVVGLSILAVILVVLMKRYAGPKPETTEAPVVQEGAAKPDSSNPYSGLRTAALAVTPQQLGISFPDNRATVYGMVMDWGMDGNVATLVSFSTGDASLYLSSGGGIFGGGGHATVSGAAKGFVGAAQAFLDKARPAASTAVPDGNSIFFYFLTGKGKFLIEERMANFQNRTSGWLPLFEEANRVISELRLLQEQR